MWDLDTEQQTHILSLQSTINDICEIGYLNIAAILF